MKGLIAAILLFGLSLMMSNAQAKLNDPLRVDGQGEGQTSTAELAEADRLDAEVVKLYRERKYDKALPLAQRVLEIRERALGADHQLVANSLTVLAILLIPEGKYDEAEQLFQRAITIKEKALGPNHRDVAKALEHYVCLLWARGKRDEADKVEKRIGEILYGAIDASGVYDLVEGRAIKLPQPPYPEEARRARLTGRIVVWVLIDETGKVVEASGRCGSPSLVKASEEAAYLALFQPTLVDGKPRKVRGYITYNFVGR